MGAVIINNKWTKGFTTNKAGDEIQAYYVAGDIISIFFGIIFGAMALGMSAPF